MAARSNTIAAVDVWVVNVPLANPFRSSFETKTGETRTIVKITTADGVEGWGETMWGAPVARLVRQLGEDMIGTSPYDLEKLRQRTRMTPFFHGYLGYAAIAALDVACWDVIGRTAGLALVDLLGGRIRTEIPITALITRADVPDVADRDLPAALADHATAAVERAGFTAVKLKGTTDVDGDVAIMRALREALPEVKLRVDPNGAWSVPDSIRATRAMSDLDLEYLEDPCSGLEPMSRVKRETEIPLCTNVRGTAGGHRARGADGCGRRDPRRRLQMGWNRGHQGARRALRDVWARNEPAQRRRTRPGDRRPLGDRRQHAGAGHRDRQHVLPA